MGDFLLKDSFEMFSILWEGLLQLHASFDEIQSIVFINAAIYQLDSQTISRDLGRKLIDLLP